MNRRIAKKIVKSHEAGKCCLSWGKIANAFRRLGAGPATRPELDSETLEHPAVDLTKLKVSELRALAKERGVTGYSSMRKGDLVALLAPGPGSSTDARNPPCGF